jgi:pimeloyl-ACP methyl ester carboxylesterase
MKVTANGLQIEVDVQGPAHGETVMLIMGLGMQLVAWPDELAADLVGRGYRVVRFDNRDVGLSDGFNHLGMPSLFAPTLRYGLHLPVASPYKLADMADDAAGVLDALGIQAAHVCGASMGGMITQHMAVRHAARVKSLTLVMTSSGARRLPQASLRVRQVLLSRPRSPEVADVVAHQTHLLRVIGSPGYPPDPLRMQTRLEAAARRAYRPAGTARQLLAVVADGDRTPMLGKIRQPTHVIHGAQDPLVPPAAGEDLAQRIAGATLDLVPGMGHDLPVPLLPRIADGIAKAANAARARPV